MQGDLPSGGPSKTWLWTGRVLNALVVLLLLASGAMKLIQPPGFSDDDGLKKLAWEPERLFVLGFVEIGVAVVYAIPRTAVLGAILVTGYMGGAIATHARVGDPYVMQIVFGVVAWLGIFLREPRLWAVLPLRKP